MIQDILMALGIVVAMIAGLGLWWLVCIGPTEFLERYTNASRRTIPQPHLAGALDTRNHDRRRLFLAGHLLTKVTPGHVDNTSTIVPFDV